MRLLLLLVCGCTTGVPLASTCIVDADCGAGQVCFAGGCTPGRRNDVDGGVAWCPTLEPKLSDINQRLFRVSCATATGSCHTTDAVQANPPSNGLDLSADPWSKLVNVRADNVEATADAGVLVRVVPGDPDDSFLMIKLRLHGRDPRYGSGMPPEQPGGVCDDTTNAVAEWIAEGAQRN